MRPPRVGIEAAVVPTMGLIGEWKLNEASGTTAADTKNGYNATVFGGSAFVAGKLGNGLDLNNGPTGTGGKYAGMPSNATLDNVQEGDYTISAWFYPYSTPPNGSADNRLWAIVAKASPHMGIVYNDAGKFIARHYLTGAVGLQASSPTVYPPGAWYHVVSAVSRTAGTVKVYVNGAVQQTTTFTPNTAAEEYGTTPFQIGKSGGFWAADGKVDQVRIYNVALSADDIADLYDETQAPTFRFPVGMSKGQQTELLGMPHTPDGHMTRQSENSIIRMLDSARAVGARVTVRVTGGNGNFYTDAANGDSTFAIVKWKNAFDNVAHIDSVLLSRYIDSTLIGHYAIDEPFADFHGMTSGLLEQICQYQKSFPAWRDVPCIVREKNTKLYENAPAGGYQYVDAGWATMADHHYDTPSTYNGDLRRYFEDNLAKGDAVGLGLMYSFGLLGGGRQFDGCAKPDPAIPPHNCAMTDDEVRELADVLVSIGDDQGCGVIGYEIEANSGSKRDYFFSQNAYQNNGIQEALAYLNSKVGGLRPGSCRNTR